MLHSRSGKWRLKAITILIAAAYAPCLAHCDITNISVFKTAFYEQTTSTPPATTLGFRFDSFVDFNMAGDLTNATTSYPGPLSPLVYSEIPGRFAYFSPVFGTQVELDTNFPVGSTYTFQISGGTLGSQSAALMAPNFEIYPSSVPYVTGPTFDELQQLNPFQDQMIIWNAFTPDPNADTAYTFFAILRSSDGAPVFTHPFGDPGQTSVVVPGGTLEPDTNYFFDMAFSNRFVFPDAGFGGAFGEVVFERRTFGNIRTIPEPSSVLLLAASAGLFIIQRRRLRFRAAPEDLIH
ncbi:MAG: PEP-CTERM sorting domain-containing protein [Pirellulaceae bacterium]